jgi:Txe/YoeB family toxin of Txe-Axe toxin-antitoxin module
MESWKDRRDEKERISGFLKESRAKKVGFGDESIYKAFLELRAGKFEEKKLASFIQKAIDKLKEDPFVGVAIPQKLWPFEYVRRFEIMNLRKYNLPRGWRLVYTIRGNEIEIISVILEWFPHKQYERRFKY